MSAAQGGYRQDDPVRGLPGGQGRETQPPVGGPPPEEDADLASAVRSTTRMRTAFYVVVLLIALGGQVSGAMEALGMPWYVALPAVGALELGGMVVLANADVRRRLGEHATLSRLLSAGIAGGAVAFNWLAHENHLEGGFYGGMSLLGYLVWLMNTENKRRDRLRAKRQLPPTPPAYEVVGHWLRHPLLTRRARTLAKAAPSLGLYGSLEAARTQVRTERRQAALSKVLRRKIRRALDGTTADIAVAVYDLDEIARRLAERADYDGLTALIAADLAPARVLAGNLPAGRRRWWRRRSGGPDAVALASADRLLNDALAVPDPGRIHPAHRAAAELAPAPARVAEPVTYATGRNEPAMADTDRFDPPTVVERLDPPSPASGERPPEEADPTAEKADPAADQADQAGERAEPVLTDEHVERGVRSEPVEQGVRSERAVRTAEPRAERGQRTNGRASRAVDRAAGAEPEQSGQPDVVDRPEPARPRWDALTAEVSAIFSTAQRRPARTSVEREAAARSAPAEPEPPASPEPSPGSVTRSEVADQPEPVTRPGMVHQPVTRPGMVHQPDAVTRSASEAASPFEQSPSEQPPVVPITERPLPDLVAAAATRTLPPSQVAPRASVEPVRVARGVASVPSGGEGSLRSRVYAALDELVSPDDERDNATLTDLMMTDLRLTPADRTNVVKYVRTWRADTTAGRRSPADADRRVRAVPGQ
ncbi:hypothetical protein ACI2K4_03050 [Micromonospora sp. NPDC050397]|uniref:hypothetical protein n=1 Tax=Micromonospora sp. NPDC050397 TaxID=3364279 RepID=UPI00384EF9B2